MLYLFEDVCVGDGHDCNSMYMLISTYSGHIHTHTHTHTTIHRLLLYLSLFGFTLEPRFYRARFQPPKTFLEHIDFTNSERLGAHLFNGGDVVMFSVDSDDPINHSNDTSHSEGSTLNCNPNSLSSTSHSGSSTYHRNQTHSTHYDRGSHLNSSNNETSTGNSIRGSSESSQATNSGHCRVHMFKVHMPDQNAKERVGNERNGNTVESEVKYTWEYALMLPATPDEVRSEVDVLLSDLIVRLKQILFNSLLCAYYVGIIPMLFADVSEWCNKYSRSIIIHIIHCSSAKLLFTFTYVHPDTHLHMFRCTHSHIHTVTPSHPHRTTSTTTSGGVWSTPSWSGPTRL